MTALCRVRRFPPLVFVAAVAVVVVLASGCRVSTDVALNVSRDGSGTVAVTVTLDREAAAQVPNLATQLKVGDLRRAGWTLEGPTTAAGGVVRVSATKRFGSSTQAGAVLDELAGRGGPFRGFAVTRSHSFAETKWRASGTVDLRKGLAAFSDQRVSALLGGKPFGRSLDEIRLLAHGSLADAAPFRVRVQLPGARDRAYIVRLGDRPLPIDTSSSETSSRAYLLSGAAVIALLGAIFLFVLSRRPRRRPPRSQRGIGTYDRRRYGPIVEPEAGPAPGTGGAPELVRVKRPAPEPKPVPRRPRPPGQGGQRPRPRRPRGAPPPGPRAPRDPGP